MARRQRLADTIYRLKLRCRGTACPYGRGLQSYGLRQIIIINSAKPTLDKYLPEFFVHPVAPYLLFKPRSSCCQALPFHGSSHQLVLSFPSTLRPRQWLPICTENSDSTTASAS